MAALLEKRVLGIQVLYIRIGGQNAKWDYEDTAALKKFMIKDEAFFVWKRRENFKVTQTTLRHFTVDQVRPLIGAGGLEGVMNVDNSPVLPIIDTKIRYKMAQLWPLLPKEDQLSGVVPWPARPQQNSQLEAALTVLREAEKERTRRALVEVEQEMAFRATRARSLAYMIEQQEADGLSSSEDSESWSDIEAALNDIEGRVRESSRRQIAIQRAIQARENEEML